MTFGSLFAGIGGMDLGLERAGMTCKWQVEIDPYARRVLAKHWPDVRRHDDVRTFPPDDGTDWGVDLIAGGFPCQPVSLAGKRGGTDDDRWLWPEFARVLRLLRPQFALLENTPGLLTAGFDAVLADLASLGFDAEWSVLSACTLGAPHTRERLFVVANTHGFGRQWRWHPGSREATDRRLQGEPEGRLDRSDWALETRPPIQRVAHRIADRAHRCRVAGNAVVPPVAEWIGRRIVEASTPLLNGLED